MEIQALEHRLSFAGASSAERHEALVRLAQLRQLSGNIAGAAVNWLEAAVADPYNDAALAAGAYCLAAIGEWEKAALALHPLLDSGRSGPAILQAQFLDASLRALSANDVSSLAALAGNSEFAAMRPLIYYTLWQTLTRNPGATTTDNAESWKSRLLAEFPQSPEARAASPEQKNSPVISAVQSPLWLLFPGTAGLPSAGTAKPATPAPAAPTVSVPAASAPTISAPVTSAPAPAAVISAPPAAASATPSQAVSQAVSAVVLQTGLFSKEANARAQSESLRKAGFTASIFRKLVNGAEYWAVTVPAGQDQRKTTADLKKAGFDSFPVK